MKKRINLSVFAMAIWIEIIAEILSDTLSMRMMLCTMLAAMTIHWYRNRNRPHFPWFDDDDWL